MIIMQCFSNFVLKKPALFVDAKRKLRLLKPPWLCGSIFGDSSSNFSTAKVQLCKFVYQKVQIFWLAPEQTFLMKDTYAKDRQFVCRVLFQNNTA